jgi:hypothetical protein
MFPTFFLAGFECSSFVWRDVGRRDLSAELQHYEHADQDYAMLGRIEIAVAREGIPGLWSIKGRQLQFSCLNPFLAAQKRYPHPAHLGPVPLWLPRRPRPVERGVRRPVRRLSREAARYVGERAHHWPLLLTPMNEPSFRGYLGGEWGCARRSAATAAPITL